MKQIKHIRTSKTGRKFVAGNGFTYWKRNYSHDEYGTHVEYDYVGKILNSYDESFVDVMEESSGTTILVITIEPSEEGQFDVIFSTDAPEGSFSAITGTFNSKKEAMKAMFDLIKKFDVPYIVGVSRENGDLTGGDLSEYKWDWEGNQ